MVSPFVQIAIRSQNFAEGIGSLPSRMSTTSSSYQIGPQPHLNKGLPAVVLEVRPIMDYQTAGALGPLLARLRGGIYTHA